MKTEAIEFVVERTTLGPLVVAASDRGVCLVRFGEERRALHADLAREFPWASLVPAGPRVRAWARAIAGCAAGQALRAEIPLDVRGSRFQQRVWNALRRIPHGQTRSYAMLARAIGRPEAVRAVARACATNPVPLVVPCHRVVRSDGSPGGYAFGVERKRALLHAESDAADRPAAAQSERAAAISGPPFAEPVRRAAPRPAAG